MRRLKILFYWVFINRNNVSFNELLHFLVKPTIGTIASKEISKIEEKETYEVTFKRLKHKLYWPPGFTLNRLHQVIAETFDVNDWHYYQKQHTTIKEGDILLDIGTAEGLFPLTVIEQCRHIYMVEPGTIFNKCLEKTFKAYKDKVTIFNVAVGNHDGEIYFDENSLDGKVSTENSVTKTEIRKIDSLIGSSPVTYIKADIEGFEEEMLRGAEQTIKRNKPKIAITTYHTENDPNEIISIIKGFVPEYKYYVKGIYEQTPKPVMIHFWI